MDKMNEKTNKQQQQKKQNPWHVAVAGLKLRPTSFRRRTDPIQRAENVILLFEFKSHLYIKFGFRSEKELK